VGDVVGVLLDQGFEEEVPARVALVVGQFLEDVMGMP
jgi:hypothetical protein